MNIFTIGLLLIIASWIFQIYKTLIEKDRDISPAFLLLYALGSSLLSIGYFMGNDVTSGMLNIGCATPAAILLITLKKSP